MEELHEILSSCLFVRKIENRQQNVPKDLEVSLKFFKNFGERRFNSFPRGNATVDTLRVGVLKAEEAKALAR